MAWKIGQQVDVTPRTHPGINKPGGVGTITDIHEEGGVPVKVDVKYVLGGREKSVEITYVKLIEQEDEGEGGRRPARQRKADVKMNLGELGGGAKMKTQKKRPALADIDGNRERKSNKKSDKKKAADAIVEGKVDVGALPAGCKMDGDWMFIKSGKLSDYTKYFTEGTMVKYMYNDKEGWLDARVTQGIHRITTAKIITWKLEVQFEDDGAKMKLPFHPTEERWKVKIGSVKKHKDDEKGKTLSELQYDKKAKSSDKKSSKHTTLKPKDEKKPSPKKKDPLPKVSPIAKASDGLELTEHADVKASRSYDNAKPKPIEEVFQAGSTSSGGTENKSNKKSKPVGTTLNANSAAAKTNNSINPAPPKLSRQIGSDTVYVSTKQKAAASLNTTYNLDNTKRPSTDNNAYAKKKDQSVSVSSFYKTDKSTLKKHPPFHAGHNYAASSSRAASSFSSNLQSKLQEVASKEAIKIKERNPTNEQNVERKLTGALTVMTGLNENHLPQSASESTAKQTASSFIVKDPSTNTTRPKNQLQSLYEKHYNEATDFLKSIKEDSTEVAEKKQHFTSSPGGSVLSSESGDLSVKVDKERVDRLTALMVEVFFKYHCDSMDVEQLVTKLNALASSVKKEPFAVLEVRTFLKQLELQGKIAIDWDGGKSGVIYNLLD